MDEAFATHYELGLERGRLFSEGEPRLELARTVELLDRFLPAPPADVLDVGGGPGVYASILARKGYRVDLIDVLPLHVDQAQAAAAEHPRRRSLRGSATRATSTPPMSPETPFSC